jgi:predicted nucleic acid-binding protein
MSIDRGTILFFDASCLVAAAGSPTGGSSFLFSVCTRGFLQAAVSQPVLLEAERNVSEQLRPEALNRYHRLIAATPMKVIPLPPRNQRGQYAEVVGEKDEHVLAAAIEGQAEFLITLDKPLEQRVNQAPVSIRAMSPGEFIKTQLTEHPEFPSMR